MSWRLLPRLAWRYLVRRRGAAGAGAYLGGAALGIGLSLVPLIVVLEVSDGLIAGITRRFLEVGSYHLQVGLPPGLEADAALRRLLLDDLAMRLELGVGAVTSAGRERQGIALAAAGARRHVVTVRSLAEDLYRRDAGLRRYLRVVAGGFDLQGRGVVVSREVARQLDLRVGDRLAVVTALDRGTTRGGAVLVPKLTPLEVSAIVATGYQELDKLWVFVSHATGDRLLPPGGGRDFVGVKVHDPFADPGSETPDGVTLTDDLDSVFEDAKFVTLHVPLMPATRHMVGERELRLIPEGGYLVNASRGPVVDEQALIRVLQAGHLAGAALDVTDPEPPLPDNPLLAMDNVIVTPHIASNTDKGVHAMMHGVADQIAQVIAGDPPRSMVDPNVWPGRFAGWSADDC
jgi:hypothetical protein